MARFRLSLLARGDVARILTTSAEHWGIDGRRRYAAVIAAGMRKVAAEPHGPTTRDRAELSRGMRSFHLRHAPAGKAEKVKAPAHVLYYRAVRPGLVEIVRVLHERMEPSRHIEESPKSKRHSAARS
jgi:toxin ParE1/3/4